MSYLRGALGVNRILDKSNEESHGRFGISSKGGRMNCGVVGTVKCRILRKFWSHEEIVRE